MLIHVKETIKDWMDKCKGIKLFLPLLMNPSTISTCFEYQKHYSMKTKCVRPDNADNADNKTFAFDKLRQTAHGIVEKGMHLKLEI